ncbi:hypothetical protein EST38_g3901 [Candolleomyces aberdarensis]|uniref:Uncharacterized protein n=1 Tax=Candolleomyces aberdarensis TaxID=2316362 RepID=A0A4Q2DQZ1_9AGAR|nr:hypothetical protein EST38_g3901 [Candolleomyces aberdarensis]
MVMEQKEREDDLRRQEDEELERALAQSMLETTSYESIPPEFLTHDQIASSSRMTLDSPQPLGSKTPSLPATGTSTPKQHAELGRYDKSRIPGYDGSSIALSEVANGKRPVSGDNSITLTASPEISVSEVPRLDGDAESGVFLDTGTMLSNFPPHDSSTPASPLHIPRSLDSGANAQDGESSFLNPSRTSESLESPSELAYFDDVPSTPPPPMDPILEEAPANPTIGNHGPVNRPGSVSPPPPRPASIHVPQATSVVMLASSSSPAPSSYNPQRQETSSSLGLGLERVVSSGSLASSLPPPSAAASAPQMGSVGHYIDPDLLQGVSIDFRPPVLQARLKPMTDAIPNIITLPFGRCPPLHIQAPSWKHLLKLLARMGNTKFEPTVKALSISKTDLKLRTIVQFVRIHPASEDWRTIVWFTLDHPVPPSLPNAQKYNNPHPNILPWSYTLGDLPMLLRNAADAPMSKTYTIPSTDSLPYPTLPITFPNLALYLQAALDFSRQAKEDNNGYRKLAKMVQTCYPNTEEPSNEAQEKTTVGGLFKRVIGRGNNKKKTGKTNNEETYEYITPFVPDEWG